MSNLGGAYVRRQELVATEAEVAANASKVLLDGEMLYVKMNNGTLRAKMGDGQTAVGNLPYTQVFDGNVVQTRGNSTTDVMSQDAVEKLMFKGGTQASDAWCEENGITSIRELPPNGVYAIADVNKIGDKPPTTESFTLIVSSPMNKSNNAYNTYLAIARTNIFFSQVSWGESSITWIPLLSQEIGTNTLSGISQNAVNEVMKSCFGSGNDIVTGETFAEKYGTSLNNAPKNKFIAGNFAGIENTPMPNFSGYVWSFTQGMNANGCIQFAMNYNGQYLWLRTAEGFTWNAWKQINILDSRKDPQSLLGNPKIVLIGDSIVHGWGASDFTNGDAIGTFGDVVKYRNSGGNCWGNRFVNKMSNDFGITCLNNGVSQWGFNEFNNYFDTLIPSDTKIVICCGGINNRGTNQTTFQTMVATFIDNCLSRNIVPIMLSPIDVNGATYNISPAKMNTIIRGQCRLKQVPWFDLYNEFNLAIATSGKTKNYFYGDTLHPNDAGYELLFYVICKLLNY